MHTWSSRPLKAWTIVIGGHVLLLLLFRNANERFEPATVATPDRTVLFFIPPPPVVPRPSEPKKVPAPAVHIVVPENLQATTTAITLPPTTEPERPAVDWRAEGERSARIIVEQSQGDRTQPAHERQPSFEWHPEPRKAGFSGLLPYVRLGKRCILGLGFFGCAIGELPKADGTLFDDMGDPNLRRSSVPNANE